MPEEKRISLKWYKAADKDELPEGRIKTVSIDVII